MDFNDVADDAILEVLALEVSGDSDNTFDFLQVVNAVVCFCSVGDDDVECFFSSIEMITLGIPELA